MTALRLAAPARVPLARAIVISLLLLVAWLPRADASSRGHPGNFGLEATHHRVAIVNGTSPRGSATETPVAVLQANCTPHAHGHGRCADQFAFGHVRVDRAVHGNNPRSHYERIKSVRILQNTQTRARFRVELNPVRCAGYDDPHTWAFQISARVANNRDRAEATIVGGGCGFTTRSTTKARVLRAVKATFARRFRGTRAGRARSVYRCATDRFRALWQCVKRIRFHGQYRCWPLNYGSFEPSLFGKHIRYRIIRIAKIGDSETLPDASECRPGGLPSPAPTGP